LILVAILISIIFVSSNLILGQKSLFLEAKIWYEIKVTIDVKKSVFMIVNKYWYEKIEPI
jgi:hypothetical protein